MNSQSHRKFLYLILPVLLIIPVIAQFYFIRSLRTSYESSEKITAEHFRSVYLSEHLRNLTQQVDVYVRRFALWEAPDFSVTYERSSSEFRKNIRTLQNLYHDDHPEKKKLIQKILSLENGKDILVKNKITLDSLRSGRIRTILKSEFRPLNEELKLTIDQLIALERSDFTSVRRNLKDRDTSIFNKLIIYSLINISLSVFIISLVMKLIRELGSALKETEKALQSRDDLIAVVSHDLKNPLSSIKLNTQLLRKRLTLVTNDDKTLGTVSSIERSTSVMQDLIQNILDEEKADAGKIELEKKEEDFSAILNETEAVLMPLAEAKDIVIAHNLPDSPTMVLCDRNKVMQILSNLLGNAIKFVRTGDKIMIEAHQRRDVLEVSIIDTGEGIKEEDLPKLFQRHWQSEKTARLGHGLGLGIVKTLVEAHGGKIWVKSKLESGTTFTFTLPLAAS